MLCECSNLDWSGCDMTAQHHPECTAVVVTDEVRDLKTYTYSYVLIHDPEMSEKLRQIEPTGSIRHTITIDNPVRKLRAYLADEEDPPAYYFRLLDRS